VMTVTLKDVNDRALWSKAIEPKCCNLSSADMSLAARTF
jgi:hypothetical protein